MMEPGAVLLSGKCYIVTKSYTKKRLLPDAEKSRTKKAATPNRQAGATADTPQHWRSVTGVYGYHTTSREMLQDSRKENEP